MGKTKLRKEIRKKQRIEDFKKELKLNEEKLQKVVAETNAKLSMVGLEKEDMQLKVDEIELVIKLGLKTLEPKFEYERHQAWQDHTEKAAKHGLDRAKKRLANLEQSIEEGKKYLASQADLEQTRKKVIVAELKKLGLDEKDIFKQETPSYIG